MTRDGGRILTAAYPDGIGRVWDGRTGRPLAVLRGPDGQGIGPASFGPDAQRIVASTAAGDARVWDVPGGRSLLRLPKPEGDSFAAAAFSPDGRRIATGELAAVTLWDATTGRSIARRTDKEDSLSTVSGLVFSRDGRLLLAVDDYGVVRVLDGRTLKPVARLKGHTSLVSTASFSPDGQLVVTGSDDQTARIWRARSGEELARLTGHGDDVTSASFSPDGKFVVTTAGDNAARIWSTASGRRVATVTAPRGAVYTAAFRPDSRSLVLTGPSLPPTLQRCDLCGGLDQLRALADQRVTRAFTRRERATYLHER
jgi:WD40 repeat protein